MAEKARMIVARALLTVAPIARYQSSGDEREGEGGKGIWLGRGLHALYGLHQGAPVNERDHSLAIRGFDLDGNRLVQNAGDSRSSYDVVFDSRKEISLVWLLNPQLRESIDSARLCALVEDVLPAFEDRILVRRGKGGTTYAPADTAFTLHNHLFSRNGDIQLHFHLGVPAVGFRADGTGAIYSRPLFTEAKKLDAIFQAGIERRFTPLVRYELGRIPEGLVRATSSRREELLEAAGGPDASGKSRQIASWATRGRKEEPSLSEVMGRTRALAEDYGYQPEHRRGLPERTPSLSGSEERVTRSGWLDEREKQAVAELGEVFWQEGEDERWIARILREDESGSAWLFRDPPLLSDEEYFHADALRAALDGPIGRPALTHNQAAVGAQEAVACSDSSSPRGSSQGRASSKLRLGLVPEESYGPSSRSERAARAIEHLKWTATAEDAFARLCTRAQEELRYAAASMRANLGSRLLHQFSPDTLLKYGVYNQKRMMRLPVHSSDFESSVEKWRRLTSRKSIVDNLTTNLLRTVAEVPKRTLTDAGRAIRCNLTTRLIRQIAPDTLLKYGLYNQARMLRPPSFVDELPAKEREARRARHSRRFREREQALYERTKARVEYLREERSHGA